MINNPQLYLDLALQEQRRLHEQPAPKVELPADVQRSRSIRSAFGRMLISTGQRLAPTAVASDHSLVTPAPASQASPAAA